jgi:hypothetical protein
VSTTTTPRRRFPPPTAATTVMLLAATVLAGSLTPAASAKAPSDDAIVTQPFSADSGDACPNSNPEVPMGFTKGTLSVHRPQIKGRLEINGTVVDHPLSGDPACQDDDRITTATFTAWVKGFPVGTVTQRADNSEQPFSATLTTHGGIAQVTVQVCRHSQVPGPENSVPADYCGAAQTHPRRPDQPATKGYGIGIWR